MQRVKTAIVLASGWGNKLKPITQNKPKPALEVNGKMLIEDAIEVALKANPLKVLVITGEFNDDFKDLEKKYDKVELFTNQFWQSKGSMHTLDLIRKELGDTLFIEASQIVHNKAIVLANYSYDTFYVDDAGCEDDWYWTFQEQEPWALVHGKGAPSWCGITFLHRDSTAEFIKKLDELLIDPKLDMKNMFYVWEKLIQERKLEPHFQSVKPGEISRINTIEDLAKLDDSYAKFLDEQYVKDFIAGRVK